MTPSASQKGINRERGISVNIKSQMPILSWRDTRTAVSENGVYQNSFFLSSIGPTKIFIDISYLGLPIRKAFYGATALIKVNVEIVLRYLL